MFKSAATRIAHNTTIPALAGNSDLRPLQDLITAEKTVLTTLQKLRVDLVKAGDALRIWGQGEGDDLGDILAASSTIMTLFSSAISTYSSLHHTVRDSMKSVRTREEALDDLRRRRRRVGASAETAEKKLHKMSPEHKNLGPQTETLNKLREEMRAMDGEILREEAELGDYKRKCAKDWMGFKFGGLVECCEQGVIVGDIGRQMIQSMPEDVTQPGLPRVQYSAHARVGGLVAEAQRAVTQVSFSSLPPGDRLIPAHVSHPPPTSQNPPAQSPFLPTPSLGSELTLGLATYSPPAGPLPAKRRASVDELGVHGVPTHPAPQFSSLPSNREREPAPVSSSVGPTPLALPTPYDSGAARSEENQSLMASIADALSHSHRAFSLEEATSLGATAIDEPAPKYESVIGDLGRSAQSEPHGPSANLNGHVGPPPAAEDREGRWHRRATRRSTSPPSLPPGAAPAAIRAWDDRMGQGEDGAHSDRPASSSADVPSQRLTSSSERDGEEEDCLAYDRESGSFGEGDGVSSDGKHRREDASESGGEASVDAENHDEQGATSIRRSVSSAASNPGISPALSRAGSQWRIPRVPPPSADADTLDVHRAVTQKRQSAQSMGTSTQEGSEEKGTDESAELRARDAAAAREVSRAKDALEFSAILPPASPSGYATPRGRPPGYGSTLSAQSQAAAPHPRVSPPVSPSLGKSPYGSGPPSPILPPNPPFANRWGGASPMAEGRSLPGHRTSENVPGRVPTPTPTPANVAPASGGNTGTPRPSSPLYRSPPADYSRPALPFSSPLMASSSSSLNGGASPGGGPRTISAAAFRRQQQARSQSGTESGPADTSPLTLRKPSSVSPPPGTGGASKARLSVVNPDPRMSDEEEGGKVSDNAGSHGGESAGYGAGRYVSDLEKS